MKKFYVYVCRVDGVVRYVGKGSGNRYKHCTSGKSTCAELNRDLFAGKTLTVEKMLVGKPERSVFAVEGILIQFLGDQLYNKVGANSSSFYDLLFLIPHYRLGMTREDKVLLCFIIRTLQRDTSINFLLCEVRDCFHISGLGAINAILAKNALVFLAQDDSGIACLKVDRKKFANTYINSFNVNQNHKEFLSRGCGSEEHF